MPTRLLAQLEAARRKRFVGRADELALFDLALEATTLPYFVLYLHGPGGIGKTTLLYQALHRARGRKMPAFYLDGHTLEPSPPAFLQALRLALGEVVPEAGEAGELPSLLAGLGRGLLVIDTYENLAPLDGWLRHDFLPQLPENVLTVLAGRQPPPLAWRTDPGWQSLMLPIPLRNLSQEEGRRYLEQREVPPDQVATVLAFTHGHPLALSLAADLFDQRPGFTFDPGQAPDMIHLLLTHLVDKVPGPLHRAALEATALVRFMTEALLARMLDEPHIHDAFVWLQELSFMDAGSGGIFPHDLAREALTADLRWRNPDLFAALHARARAYYMERVTQGEPREQRRVLSDYIYLHRDNPMVRPFLTWQQAGSVYTDGLRQGDVPAILEMVARHEGAESAAIAAAWLERQPQGVAVFRSGGEEVHGFLQQIALERLAPGEPAADPAVAAASRYLAQLPPLRQGERATLFRFWMAAEGYQAVSPVQSRIFINIVQHYLTTPGLAFHFIVVAEPDFWTPVFSYADLKRLPACDFTAGGHRYGVYGRDWRASPPLAWLALLAERELTTEPGAPPPPQETLLVLSEGDFATAVRHALRACTDPVALGNNPLLRSRLVVDRAGEGERVPALQALLEEVAGELQATPRQRKFYRALYHTYLRPAPTQERAAELLDLPFSTYRRHLKAGVQYLIGRLWQLELPASGEMTA